MPTLSLNIIPFAAVQKALEAAEAADQATDKFNTHFHTHAEIAATAREPEDTPNKHVYPGLTVPHFSHWIDLIASSQGFHEYHEFIIPTSLALTGKAISDDTMEDLLARFRSGTSQGVETRTVFDGQKEWFLRLDFCSTKDARTQDDAKYRSSIREVQDALQRIPASRRAIRALEDIVLKKAPGPARLFFIPHNKHMDTSREFRVFCPPVWTLSALSDRQKHMHRGEATQSQRRRATNWKDDSNIAISQYRWYAPYHGQSLAAAEADAEKVLAAATSTHSRIVSHATASTDRRDILKRLRTEGFVFDIFEATNGDMQLLEILAVCKVVGLGLSLTGYAPGLGF